MTGNRRARIVEMADHCLEIPSASTPKIQEGHIIVGHIVCGLIEEAMFGRKADAATGAALAAANAP
jgi:D-sedoheptulose 7-phosphate isomerase